MKISLGIGIGLTPTRRAAQIITRVSSPAFGPYVAGDTPEDEYTPGVYASSAGDIASVVPAWTVNSTSAGGDTALEAGDVVRLVSETVTDDEANERVFGYSGTQTVQAGIIITADIEPELLPLSNGDVLGDRISEDIGELSNYSSTAGEITAVTITATINGGPADLTDTVAWEDVAVVSVKVEDDASNERIWALEQAVAEEPPAPDPTAPDQFLSGQWSVNSDGEVTFSSLPNDGGSAITDLEYRLDTGSGFGSAVSFGETTTGTYATTGEEGDLVQVRAVNAIDDGDWSTSKAVPAVSTGDELTNIVFDPEEGTFSFDSSESGDLYWITSAEAERTAQQIIDGTGAEDADSFPVLFGPFSGEVSFPTTTAGQDRYFHAVLVYGDDQRSNVFSSTAFQIEVQSLPFPRVITLGVPNGGGRLNSVFDGQVVAKFTFAMRFVVGPTPGTNAILRGDAGSSPIEAITLDFSSSRLRLRVYSNADPQVNLFSNDLRTGSSVTFAENDIVSVIGAVDLTKTDLGTGVSGKLWYNGTTLSTTAGAGTEEITLPGPASGDRHLRLPFSASACKGIRTWFWFAAGHALDPATVAGSFFDSENSWAERDIWAGSEGVISGVTPTHFITGGATEWNALVNRGSSVDFLKDGTFVEPD